MDGSTPSVLPDDLEKGGKSRASSWIPHKTRQLRPKRVSSGTASRGPVMPPADTIEIPNADGTSFDHGALEPETRRVFIAHTARDCLEVVDADTNRHLATLQGFPGAAGVVAGNGRVLVTNRGAANLALVDARSLKTLKVLNTGPRPNGAAFVPSLQVGIVACIGDDTHAPQLQVFGLEDDRKWSLDLPGRPRWCVVTQRKSGYSWPSAIRPWCSLQTCRT
jgi:hypothetical protein